jgi:hypothetical protein
MSSYEIILFAAVVKYEANCIIYRSAGGLPATKKNYHILIISN